MSRNFKLTAAQRDVLRQLSDGMIIKADSRSYSLFDTDGRYIGKASIAVKSLAQYGLIGATGKRQRIYFTRRGFSFYYGGEPIGDCAELVNKVEVYATYIRSMLDTPEDERDVVGWWAS